MGRKRKWKEREDYSTLPKSEWCDMDYIAVWLRELKYEPKTSIWDLGKVMMEEYREICDPLDPDSYFAIKDPRERPDNLMVYIPDLAEFVKANGGIEKFDKKYDPNFYKEKVVEEYFFYLD